MPETGKVKWFNEWKGYGFIREGTGETLYVHHSQIRMEGYRTLKPGTRVRFEVEEGPHGREATAVSPVPGEAAPRAGSKAPQPAGPGRRY